MFNAIKGFFASKSSFAAILGSAVVGVMYYFNLPLEIIGMVAGLFGLKITQQGMADLGKNKA